VALRGEGVRETLVRILTLVWQRLNPAHGLEALLGVDEATFIERLVGRP